jgi:cyclic pyranopterin phosphate synthase
MISDLPLTLTHLDAAGAARMVDVSDKPVVRREAIASARVVMQPATLALILANGLPKGDVLAVARVAGILAAKRTGELIPLCHPLGLDSITVHLAPAAEDRLAITSHATVSARTGVEMEALIAVSVAGLAVYDMCKAVDRSMQITDIQLEEKLGGSSGHFRRPHKET